MEDNILKQIQLLHAKLDTLNLNAQGLEGRIGSPQTGIKKEEED
jgi:hypothetical protein